ncbi:MAG: hypothetical protein HYU66_24790 [Armatimonadetes bacterium]|nr:hypothetical protein [Armatimonadota bacterium]
MSTTKPLRQHGWTWSIPRALSRWFTLSWMLPEDCRVGWLVAIAGLCAALLWTVARR